MTMPRNIAIVPVSLELLAHALCLPAGTKVLSVTPENDVGEMYLKVYHPELPLVPEGERLPTAHAIVCTERIERPYSRGFRLWNRTVADGVAREEK